jgi:hypothetical protein
VRPGQREPPSPMATGAAAHTQPGQPWDSPRTTVSTRLPAQRTRATGPSGRGGHGPGTQGLHGGYGPTGPADRLLSGPVCRRTRGHANGVARARVETRRSRGAGGSHPAPVPPAVGCPPGRAARRAPPPAGAARAGGRSPGLTAPRQPAGAFQDVRLPCWQCPDLAVLTRG